MNELDKARFLGRGIRKKNSFQAIQGGSKGVLRELGPRNRVFWDIVLYRVTI